MSSYGSSFGSDSDLDDVPLYFADPVPTPRSNKPPGFSLSNIQATRSLADASTTLQSPRPSSCVPGLSLGKVPGAQPHTPDPTAEPLPSTRGVPPVFKLGLPQRTQESLPEAEDSGLDRTTSEFGNFASPHSLGPAPRTASAPAAETNANKSANMANMNNKMHKPPMLNLKDPASASPALSPLITAAASQPQPAAASSSNARVVVSLLSSAFAVDRPVTDADSLADTEASSAPTTTTTTSMRDRVALRCANGLGIAADELRFFTLSELTPGEEISAGIGHVAVLVDNSGFSLPALEQMLLDQQKMQTQAEAATTVYNDYKVAMERVVQLTQALAERTKDLEMRDMERAHDKAEMARLRAELGSTKEAFQQCDDQRRQLVGTVSTLKSEFTAMMISSRLGTHTSSSS